MRQAQACQYPALDDQYGALDLGLVSGVRGSGRQQGAAVVGGEFFVQAVVLRVVAAGVFDQGAGLVGHDQAWCTTEMLQCQHLSANPVGCGLARRGTGEGVVRCAQGGDEDLRFGDLPCDGINQGNSLTGVVHEQLLAANVDLAHGAFEAHGPFAVLDAKAGVLEGQVIVFGVFLPEQLQGDTGAFEFSVYVGEVGELLLAVTR